MIGSKTRSYSRTFLLLCLVIGLGASLVAPASSNSGASYLAQTIATSPNSISGAAIGDFDRSHPGNEIVIVSGTDATEIYYDRGNWPSRLLFRDATLVLGVAVGDFDSNNPGDEIVTVGQSGKVAEVYGNETRWNARFLYKDPMDLEHVAIGDVDDDGHHEIVVGGSSGKLTIIYEQGSNWASQVIFTEPTGIAGLAIGDFDSSHDGNEIAVIGQRDGEVFEIYRSGAVWFSRLIWTDDKATPSSGLTSVAVGEFNTSHPSSGVVVGDAFGRVIGIQGSGSDWSASTIYRFAGPIASVAVGDFDATHYGKEIAVAEYDSHHVFQVHNSGSGWTAQLIFSDLDAPRVIAIGDFYDDSKNAVITAGFSRMATMLHERVPPPPSPQIEFMYNITFASAPGVASITIDNDTYSPDQLPRMFTWMRGSYHSFNCSSSVIGNSTVRYMFTSWNDGFRSPSRELTVSENRTFVAGYRTQFYLTVTSPFGSPRGEGWYDAGSKAFVSTPESMPIDDVYGSLGTRYLFESWRGGLYTQQPNALVLMDEPKSMWAVWRTDYTYFAIVSVVVLAASTSGFALALFKLRRMGLLKAPGVRWHTTELKQGVAVLLILVAIYKTLSTLEAPPWVALGLSALPGLGWIGYRLLYAKYSKRSADQ